MKINNLCNYSFTQSCVYYVFLKNILYTLIVEIKSGSCLSKEQFSFMRRKYLVRLVWFFIATDARAYLITLFTCICFEL